MKVIKDEYFGSQNPGWKIVISLLCFSQVRFFFSGDLKRYSSNAAAVFRLCSILRCFGEVERVPIRTAKADLEVGEPSKEAVCSMWWTFSHVLPREEWKVSAGSGVCLLSKCPWCRSHPTPCSFQYGSASDHSPPNHRNALYDIATIKVTSYKLNHKITGDLRPGPPFPIPNLLENKGA